MSEEINGDDLARAPLSDICDALRNMESGSTLRKTFKDVLRVVAFELIGGAVPDGMTAKEAAGKGRDLLALLHENPV